MFGTKQKNKNPVSVMEPGWNQQASTMMAKSEKYFFLQLDALQHSAEATCSVGHQYVPGSRNNEVKKKLLKTIMYYACQCNTEEDSLYSYDQKGFGVMKPLSTLSVINLLYG